jgi:ATP-binding cassette subfamily C (CFTR/MRP) protein 1
MSRYLIVYSSISLCVVVLHISRQVLYASAGQRASRSIHQRLLKAVLGARLSFFNTTPSGAITSRFSSDMGAVDSDLSGSIAAVVDAFLGIITGVAVVMIASPYYVLFIVPLVWTYSYVQSKYRCR